MPRHLQREIDQLKTRIVTMGGEVEDRVYKATLSVIRRDLSLAQSVIAADHDIDNMEVAIEEDCLKVLALYQPVAIDLRFIIAVLKINSDLERVGDLAVNIAERSVYLASQEEPIDMPFDPVDMSTKVEKMLTQSIDSLVKLDVRLARQVRAMDEEIDTINRTMYSQAKGLIQAHPERVNALLHAISICRHLERIADHASNIAEDVIYLVNAEIVRHTPEIFEE